jgi:hypothetical protein
MTAPHDRPTASELLQAVREWMEQDLVTGVDGRLAFQVRVAMNMLDIVDREITLGAPMESRHEDVLQAMGVASDAELSLKIRRGDFDEEFPALLMALRPVVEDKVRVANPKYLR